jgi:type IV pilus assembly protein PilW
MIAMTKNIFHSPKPARVIHKSHGVQSGVTLVELLIALVLGLFLIGGVISVYLSTQQNFKTTENLSRLQEGARFAFEQMGREIREAGATPCGVKAVSSIMRTSTSTTPPWWADWDNGTLVGYESGTASPGSAFGSSVNDRVTTTDAIMIMRLNMNDAALRTISSHDTSSLAITVDSAKNYEADEVVMACDNDSGVIFELFATTASPTATPQIMNYQSSASDGNCTNLLGWPQPADCNYTTVTKVLSPGGFVTKYDPALWYIGIGSNGTSRSLYRTALVYRTVGGNKVATTEPREMVTDVHNLNVEYLTRDTSTTPIALAVNWINADDAKFSAANNGWRQYSISGSTGVNINEVVAVRLTLTFRSPDAVGSDGSPLERKTVAVIAMRNRDLKPS